MLHIRLQWEINVLRQATYVDEVIRLYSTNWHTQFTVLRFTLSTSHLFQSTGLAQPVPHSLSELQSPDESQLYEVSQFLLLVLTHPRWLPEGCPYLRSTVAVLAIWGCICMNVQPVTIKNTCMIMVPLLENGHLYKELSATFVTSLNKWSVSNNTVTLLNDPSTSASMD